MDLFSIVIPVYNSEKYLKDCLGSILSQSLTNFEVILINDGSTDNSGAICDSFALQDSRITAYHQKNLGVSAARNLGLKHATGQWIIFVDSDDLIGNNYFQPLKSSTSDFIMLNVDIIERGKIINFTNYPPRSMDLETFMQTYTLYPNFAGPWSKFFKSSIIKDNCLRFDTKLSFGEDALFNLEYLKKCKTCEVTNSSSYIYRESEGTLSKKKASYEDNRYLFSLLKKELLDYNEIIHAQNIISPLNRLLISLYQDKEIPFSIKRLELKNIILNNFPALKELYKNSHLGKLFFLSKNTRSFFLLNWILMQKLGRSN